MKNFSIFAVCLFLLIMHYSHVSTADEYVLHSVEKDIDIHPLVPESKSIQVEISKGDTIFTAMKRMKLQPSEISDVISALRKFYDPSKLHESDMINVIVGGYNSIESFSLTPSHMRNSINISRVEDGRFFAKIVDNLKNKKIVRTRDTIRSSLFETASEQGMFSSTIMKLADICKKRIDIDKKLTQGSILDVLFERFFDKDDRPILDGKILYASIKTDNATLSLYNYSTTNGYNGYFDPDGNAIVDSPLDSPIDDGYYRVSSPFGRRKHPIYGYYRMHEGVDLAANAGTPVKATGDGIIDFVGRNGAYGKYIRIKHSRGYSTAYGHLLDYSEHIRKGSKVFKGQIIGYVGKSGLATGSHLHYEVIRDGKHIDPMSLRAARAIAKIPGSELPKFKSAVSRINMLLENTPYKTEVAMNTEVSSHKKNTIQMQKREIDDNSKENQ